MNNILSEMPYDQEQLSEDEKLDQAFHDMEMLYKSRCVDVPLSSNVKVENIEETSADASETEK